MENSEVYHVDTVETVDTPQDVAPSKWCRYIVANARSRIVGRYRGSLPQARRNAERLAKGLNERRQTGKSPWIPSGRRKGANSRTQTKGGHA